MHPHYDSPEIPPPPPATPKKKWNPFLKLGPPQAAQLIKLYIPTIRDKHQQYILNLEE